MKFHKHQNKYIISATYTTFPIPHPLQNIKVIGVVRDQFDKIADTLFHYLLAGAEDMNPFSEFLPPPSLQPLKKLRLRQIFFKNMFFRE